MQPEKQRSNLIAQVCVSIALGLAGATAWVWAVGIDELLAFGSDRKPISPVAIPLWFFIGMALLFLKRLPNSRLTLWLARGVAGVSGMAGVLIMLRYRFDWGAPVEAWLVHTSAHVGNFPVGYISSQGGTMLVIVALALGLRQPVGGMHGWRGCVVKLCAAVTTVFGLFVVASYSFEATWVTGVSINPTPLAVGLIFVFLGIGLWVQEPSYLARMGLRPAVIAIAAAVVVGAGTVYGTRHLQAQDRDDARDLLETIGKLKAKQITEWRHERLKDARAFVQTPNLARDVVKLLENPDLEPVRTDLKQWLEAVRFSDLYTSVELFDTNCVRRLSAPALTNSPCGELCATLRAVLQSNDGGFWDLHSGKSGGVVHFDIACPVRLGNQPVAILVLCVNPRQFLFPLLQEWPMPSATAETLLLRPESRSMVCLNEFGNRTKVSQSVMRQTKVLVETLDSRNTPVLTMTRPVPDSPWYIMTKVDRSEVYAKLYEQAWWAMWVTVFITVGAVLFVLQIWERQRLVLADRIEQLLKNANDAILIQDEHLKILEANDRALEMYGYTLAEMRALRSEIDLRAPKAQLHFQPQVDPLFTESRDAYETMHQRKDGSLFYVEGSSRVVESTGKRYVLTIIRNISERKAHEAEITRINRLYNILSQINHTVIRVQTRKKLMQEICRLAVTHGGFRLAWIGWLDKKTQIVMPAARDGESQEFLDKIIIYADDRPEGQGTVGRCIRSGKPVFTNDVANDSMVARWRDYALAYNIHSIASFPIRLNGFVAGVLQVASGEMDVFQDKEVALLSEIAADVSYALDTFDKEEQRQQAHNELFESREHYRSLFSNMVEGFARCQMLYADGQPTDFIYLEVNPAFEKLTGLKNVTGKTVSEVIPDIQKTNPEIFAIYGRVVQTGKPEQFEAYLKGLDIWLEVAAYSAGPGMFVAVFDNVTERRRAEEQLRKQHVLLRTLVDSLTEEFFVKDAAGRYLLCNQAHLKNYGLANESAIIGKTVFEIASPELAQAQHARDVRVLQGGETIRNFENSFTDATGQVQWRLTTKIPLRALNGAVTGMLGFHHDITQHKITEQQIQETNRQLTLALTDLRAAQQQLVEQERLRALGQMASGIAHDFNNALAPIVGFADLLLEHPDQAADPKRVAQYLTLIKASAQNASQVVRRLREFYRRRGQGEIFLPLELNELIQQTIELTRPRWQLQTQAAGVTIVMQKDLGKIPVINGNAAELRDALTNLIFNAVDSLPKGGTITIRTAQTEQHVRIEVADSGAGMSEEVKAHCFEPFFSTKGEHGTGLGLALVHGIVRRHDGTIEVESQPGIGTTFTIHLPLIINQLVPAKPSPASLPATPAHILLVDDEVQLCEMLRALLKIDGHSVELAGSGAEALEKFKPGKFDFVITDQAMPGMTGSQLAAAIKKQSPATPVILLTGFGAFMEAEGEPPAGVDLVLAKPISVADLRTALRNIRQSAAN